MTHLQLDATERSSSSERGAVLAMAALVMTLLLAIAAFATDLGAWYQQGQTQQRDSDVAALNGIQAYNRAVLEEFELLGVASWAELTNTGRSQVELASMSTALETVVGLLEVSGYSFSTTATMTQLSPPPQAAGASSTFIIIADDGSEVLVERVGDELRVTITKTGNQYLSSIIRDAPEIIRSGAAVMSNCGARCTVDFVISPPAKGFEADGAGDGWAPLRYGTDEVWAVNHHVDKPDKGSIICMKRSGAPCRSNGQQFSLVTPDDGLMFTAQQGVDHLDENLGKLYFTALSTESYVDPATGNEESDWSGLACFDVAARNWCSDAFKPLFRDNGRDGDQKVNATGPWAWQNSAGTTELYVMLQDGTLACVQASTMSTCGTWVTPVSSLSQIPDRFDDSELIEARIVGDKGYFVHKTDSNASVLQCWNLQTKGACWSSPVVEPTMADPKSNATFLAYDQSQTPTSICIGGMTTHRCYALSNGAYLGDSLPGYSDMLDVGAGKFSSALEWEGKRVFFSDNKGDRTFCYSFEDAASCGSLNQQDLLPSSLAGQTTKPYAFGLLEGNCIAGLGHNAIFFAFDAENLTKCDTAETWIQILPCACSDASTGSRFGMLSVPTELLDVVSSLEATVVQADGVELYTDLEIKETGELDLSVADQTQSHLSLKLSAASLLNNDGTLVWTEAYHAQLEVLVQPTLSK